MTGILIDNHSYVIYRALGIYIDNRDYVISIIYGICYV